MTMHSHRTQRRRQSSRGQRRQANRPPRTRVIPQPEPVDYSLDYAYVRRDLIRITIWSLILFAGMIAIWLIV